MLNDLPIVSLYIDPGTGFLALQIFFGAMLGAAFYFRMRLLSFFSRVRLFVKRGTDPTKTPHEPDIDSE